MLDPQTLTRDALARLLESAGIAVVSAHHDPHAFLTALGHERPGVAIIDLELGDEGAGMTVVEETHQLYPDVRLLVLSPLLDTDAMDACFRAGAAGYLDKSSTR